MGNPPRKYGKSEKMRSDTAMAREYIADIGGSGKGEAIIAVAYSLLSRLFPHTENPKEQWTRRRVRGFWERDAAHVKFREMVELHHAAAHAKEERALLDKARKEHAAFIAKTASLRALLERQDEDFHRPQIEGLGSVVGGVDRPGDQQ